MFFLIFHAWTNLFAEFTRFADRRFYADWWNAGDLGEYWRKWNHPIHNWLIRHCYYPLVRRGVSADMAKFLTFLFSALAHEYCVVGIFRVNNFMGFLLMIVNVPAMQLQNMLKGVVPKNVNNLVFWFGYVCTGQPFGILLCYY
jgi:diacylglycerol O-acyltransferase 1